MVMNYVISGKKGAQRDLSWLQLFDCLIVGASKPQFFSEENPKDIFEVDPVGGTLRNTLNGRPIQPIGEEPRQLDFEAFRQEQQAKQQENGAANLGNKVFQGGNFRHLHAKLGINSSTKVLSGNSLLFRFHCFGCP